MLMLLITATLVLGADEPAASQGAETPATRQAAATQAGESENGPALLAEVRDDTFNFDEPAFYWLVERARGETLSAGPDERVTPWRFLLERPSEYRGRRVVVEGFVLSSVGYEIVRGGRSFGHVMQTELSESGTRGLCTVISTGNDEPLTIGARVRAGAWFLKSRRFSTTTGEIASAPLLVAKKIEMTARPDELTRQGAARRSEGRTRDLLMIGIVMLAGVWLVLRRATRRPRDRKV